MKKDRRGRCAESKDRLIKRNRISNKKTILNTILHSVGAFVKIQSFKAQGTEG